MSSTPHVCKERSNSFTHKLLDASSSELRFEGSIDEVEEEEEIVLYQLDYRVKDLLRALDMNPYITDEVLACLPPTRHLTKASRAAGNSETHYNFAQKVMQAPGFNWKKFANRFENMLDDQLARHGRHITQIEVARGIVDMARRIAVVGV